MNTDRVTIIAIGNNQYDNLRSLVGTHRDVQNLKSVLVGNASTAIFDDSQFNEHYDITVNEFNRILCDYSQSRSAINDILILYFSGHGVPIGNFDFGLCMKDTIYLPEKKTTLSLSVVRFQDIIETLSVVGVDPVIILDACYSSQTGKNITSSMDQMKREIQAETGSNYALLCSASKIEESVDTSSGGTFSKLVFSLIERDLLGNNSRAYYTLNELYAPLRREIEQNEYELSPRLFIGGTLQEFGIIRNKDFRPVSYTFTKSFKQILNIFWNDGNPVDFTTEDLRHRGCTEQTTYTKLSYLPGWGLIEKPKRGKGRISAKGIRFINGEIEIPFEIIKMNDSDEYVASEGTKMIKYEDIE